MEEKIKKIIVEQLGCNPDKVTPEANFENDLGADSLDLIELVMVMEEEFDIEIPKEDSYKLTTVNDVMLYITAKTA